MRKRLMAICAIILMATFLSNFAQASRQGDLGGKMKWVLNDKGVLTIIGEGDMPDFEKAEDAPWNAYRDQIVGIVFSGKITRIGNYAFTECTKVKHVSFVDTIKSIGKRAFYSCGLLSASNSREGSAVILKNGDVNEDGAVDGRDSIRLMKYLAGETDPETGDTFIINEFNADINGDGNVDEHDLLRLMRYLSGEIQTL